MVRMHGAHVLYWFVAMRGGPVGPPNSIFLCRFVEEGPLAPSCVNLLCGRITIVCSIFQFVTHQFGLALTDPFERLLVSRRPDPEGGGLDLGPGGS